MDLCETLVHARLRALGQRRLLRFLSDLGSECVHYIAICLSNATLRSGSL